MLNCDFGFALNRSSSVSFLYNHWCSATDGFAFLLINHLTNKKITCEIVERRPFPSGYPIAASELSLGNLKMRIEDGLWLQNMILNLEGMAKAGE